MVLYCYPDGTYSIYHCFKQWLPKWVRSFLQSKRMTRMWTNVTSMIQRRKREVTIDVQKKLRSLLNMINHLLAKQNIDISIQFPLMIISISVACVLKYYTNWEFTSALTVSITVGYLAFILCIIIFICFLQPLAKHINHLMASARKVPDLLTALKQNTQSNQM